MKLFASGAISISLLVALTSVISDGETDGGPSLPRMLGRAESVSDVFDAVLDGDADGLIERVDWQLATCRRGSPCLDETRSGTPAINIGWPARLFAGPEGLRTMLEPLIGPELVLTFASYDGSLSEVRGTEVFLGFEHRSAVGNTGRNPAGEPIRGLFLVLSPAAETPIVEIIAVTDELTPYTIASAHCLEGHSILRS